MGHTDIIRRRKRKHVAIFLRIVASILICFCLGFAYIWNIAETAQAAAM